MGKLFVAAKKAQKSVGPKGAGSASGGSPSSARRLWTVASGTVTPKSQVSESCPTRMSTVPSRSFHQTGALAQVPTLSVRRWSQSVFSMSASFQSSSVVAQMFSSHVSHCSLPTPGLSTSLRASTVTFTMARCWQQCRRGTSQVVRDDLDDRARNGHGD
jgi:hypothetical protein